MDFVQTMKDWRRMCKHYSGESMKDEQHSCVDMCPLGHNTACGMIEDALDSDIEVMAKEVAKWAAEHPEPVYPSIAKYLEQFGIIIRRDGSLQADFFKANEPMSADMAKLLGISSEEGENEKTD